MITYILSYASWRLLTRKDATWEWPEVRWGVPQGSVLGNNISYKRFIPTNQNFTIKPNAEDGQLHNSNADPVSMKGRVSNEVKTQLMSGSSSTEWYLILEKTKRWYLETLTVSLIRGTRSEDLVLIRLTKPYSWNESTWQSAKYQAKRRFLLRKIMGRIKSSCNCKTGT